MSDIDRDQFYADNEWDDSMEYEVEPPDPDVLAAEDRRAKEIVAATQLSIDVDELYRKHDERHDREFLDELIGKFHFRFRTKHLLMVTTIVAVVIAVAVQQSAGAVFVLGMMLAVGGLTGYLSWRQYQHEKEVERRREELFARRRSAQKALLQQQGGKQATDDALDEEDDSSAVDTMWDEPIAEEKFRFRFSLNEMMVTAVCVAVLIGLIASLGLPTTATLIGFIALGGLVLHAMGVEPPHEVVFGWWVLLVLYVLLSIVAVIFGGYL